MTVFANFCFFFFFSSRRRHTRFDCDWSSDVCSSDLPELVCGAPQRVQHAAARLLPPEPRPAARLQPRVPAPPPPPDAHRALEAPPRHGVSSRGLRPRSVRTYTVAAECPMTTRLTPKEPETYPPPRPF